MIYFNYVFVWFVLFVLVNLSFLFCVYRSVCHFSVCITLMLAIFNIHNNNNNNNNVNYNIYICLYYSLFIKELFLDDSFYLFVTVFVL